jgi:hypothetical protein
MNYIGLTIRPRHEDGVDWSAERIVLVTDGQRELWWRKTGKRWGDQLHPSIHMPGSLMLVFVNKNNGRDSRVRRLHEGGRLSKRLLLQHREAIDQFFGQDGVAAAVDPRRTLVLSEQP